MLAWLTVIAITTCHEFAHGLTCKHYGGENHEIGFRLMYGRPRFFCNVSDAWLFREKAKRVWVTLAGALLRPGALGLAVFRLAADAPGLLAELHRLGRAVDPRRADLLQHQPPAETRRLATC